MSLVQCGRKVSESGFHPPKLDVELTRHCRSLHAASGNAMLAAVPQSEFKTELVRPIAKLQTNKPFHVKKKLAQSPLKQFSFFCGKPETGLQLIPLSHFCAHGCAHRVEVMPHLLLQLLELAG
jgi:hypothetical protein